MPSNLAGILVFVIPNVWQNVPMTSRLHFFGIFSVNSQKPYDMWSELLLRCPETKLQLKKCKTTAWSPI